MGLIRISHSFPRSEGKNGFENHSFPRSEGKNDHSFPRSEGKNGFENHSFPRCEGKNDFKKLYYTILYYTILYYTILYYTILYYIILNYIILYYTILYIVYYTILYYQILVLTRPQNHSFPRCEGKNDFEAWAGGYLVTPMLYRMLFLLTNVGKVWVFLGIFLGKVVGMEWQAEGLPPPLPLGG